MNSGGCRRRPNAGDSQAKRQTPKQNEPLFLCAPHMDTLTGEKRGGGSGGKEEKPGCHMLDAVRARINGKIEKRQYNFLTKNCPKCKRIDKDNSCPRFLERASQKGGQI